MRESPEAGERCAHGHIDLGERGHARRCGLEGAHHPHRHLEAISPWTRMVRRLKLEGDGQGDLSGHGGPNRAVLVYQLDSYRHWQEHLKRDDFVHGQFGENFTVDGLPDDEVCIGDQYRIGEASFEVTQPRVTCYRVGLRMNEPHMPALLVSHGRPGFYFKVLTEDLVQAGDEIVRTLRGPEAMTVQEIDALLYKPGHPRPQLERVLRIPALSPGWKGSIQSLFNDSGDGHRGNSGLSGPAIPPPAWQGFRRLPVIDITAESTSVFSLSLGADDGNSLPPALPGQFISVRMQPHPLDPPVIRSYSLSAAPGATTYRISVKQEPRGVGSSYLHQHVAVHDFLDVAAPRGSFILTDSPRPVVLICAGVGVTPVLAMLHSLAATSDPRPVWWVWGTRRQRTPLRRGSPRSARTAAGKPSTRHLQQAARSRHPRDPTIRALADSHPTSSPTSNYPQRRRPTSAARPSSWTT
ncbi:MOSC domain-containing protein [Streptomyces sp. NPDC005227]|uniref:MOSC domain-containing protein n=1 Tax=Streptomyces sp. NPDC005227 TaxID=3364707 RepID=UPI0036C51355